LAQGTTGQDTPVLAAGAVVTTVRNGGTNAPPKDGGATACRTFAAGWAGLALPAFTVTAPATSARWAGPAMPNADSGGLNVRLRGGVAVGSGICVNRGLSHLKSVRRGDPAVGVPFCRDRLPRGAIWTEPRLHEAAATGGARSPTRLVVGQNRHRLAVRVTGTRSGPVAAANADEPAVARLLQELAQLNQDLSVPSPWAYGIDARRWQELLPVMAGQALASGSPANNPRVPSASEIEDLYRQAWG
jgi:hypothetical protein